MFPISISFDTHFSIYVIFGAFSLEIRGRNLKGFLCGFREGFTHEYLDTLFLAISPLKSMEKSFYLAFLDELVERCS